MIINNVKTQNFPYEVIDGEEHYPLHSAAVVESIADQIPDAVKPSVTIDYDQIPASYFEKVKAELGLRSVDPEEALQHERKLLTTLDQEGAFSN
ncbi:hypothetical protein ABD76_25905 [Paenibacillus dendritiformis]|uniref:hypothetical protein n=1 Tax=Paenibacillus dendritiformis TaxID=130049 RepID=UPI0018CD32E6|nr:hypothetical protein [Paenibacillus dendritiformis]MBG9795333.1 hypothetical protein [Paenibacillus dendritiformis]MBG9795624.1 hypothetical protein [Paenibacillus dendritiformis]MBG9795693.1 hypothetical protein [Paenibacillus dendritiformis]MBG9795709.1 hypothetical protein [Paenibacillus dendritiformis]